MKNSMNIGFKLSLAISIVWLLCGVLSMQASGAAVDELTLRVAVTTGDHSKGNSSQTTYVTVTSDDKIAWESASGSLRAIQVPPVDEFTLSAAEKGKLVAIVASGKRLRLDSIELPRDPNDSRYFQITVESSLNREISTLRITASNTAVSLKNETAYTYSITLIDALYGIIRSHGTVTDSTKLIMPPLTLAKNYETRCGWFDNPTPANYSLYDKDSEWIIGVQGGYQVDDFDWPDFKKQWVATNNSYGYGCACFQMTVDPETSRAVEIKKSYARPLSACRKDKVLRKKWGFTMK